MTFLDQRFYRSNTVLSSNRGWKRLGRKEVKQRVGHWLSGSPRPAQQNVGSSESKNRPRERMPTQLLRRRPTIERQVSALNPGRA
jgi:hypothetical protein